MKDKQEPKQPPAIAHLEELLAAGKLKGEHLKQELSVYSDLCFAPVPEGYASRFAVFYCDGMIDHAELNEYMNPLIAWLDQGGSEQGGPPVSPPIIEADTASWMIDLLFTGYVLFHQAGERRFHALNIADIPKRQPAESNTEISIKGPKDAFTEEVNTNLALIRKRLQTSHLFSEQFDIGSLSRTKVYLVYLEHKADPVLIDEIRKRLSSFETESIIGSGQLEQWLSDRSFSLFPLLDYIARPDFATECLLRGRFIVIVNGSPMVLIGPINFFEVLKSPEDVHYPYHFVMLQRLIRMVGFLIAIFLPGFWVAIGSVNVSQIPFQLLATVVVSRSGIPLPLALEALTLLILFELLREAGVRLPKAVGQTVGIVGGIIIGDAAVRAGLASPTMLVVISTSAVATFVLVNQSLSGTVSVIRLFVLFFSSYLGVYGFMLSGIGILIYLCRLDSFGLNYLEPIASLQFREWMSALALNPRQRRNYMATMLKKRKKG
ncbi:MULTISPECIES: spore germination protein [unclassified Paenibacillus]|uniref:spore germination protein n=1 Tax=unclassified Paenibacillus TaxID=185978 RepID=UPI000432A39B|nr:MULTISPECIES: spore germination protein [unclassified Paenibacillus]KKC46435.1 spore gernimation protein GerA [Paenibacillus sp. D9]CDN44570.1 Spore germination protein XA [Paenibacillus sp. P22]